MAVNWSAGLMRWRPHVDGAGKSYSLSHLHPFRYELALASHGMHPAMTVIISIGFGLHCFTRKCLPTDAACDFYRDDRETRTFDPRRYRLSKHLTTIARSLPERRCAHAKDENYLTVDLTEDDGAAVRYGVFFNVKRWVSDGQKGVLVVLQSAYPLDATKPEPGRGRIGFKVLVGHALRGTKPKVPR